MNPDELQHLPANQLIIFPQGSPAIMAKKNVYYSDPRYTNKVNLPPPKNRQELLQECLNTTKPDPSKRQWFNIPEEMYMQSEDPIIEPFFLAKIPTDEEITEISNSQRIGAI
jgi:type IV secretory pathway TraG/TraD family ATPase VirD4